MILESTNLFVNQSILTGESQPSEKKPDKVSDDARLEERTNCVYTGTSVQSGNAKMLVVEKGANTEFGRIADKLSLRPPETEFERGERRFGYLLTEIMLILTLVVFAINVIMNRPAIENFGSMDILYTDKTGTLTEGAIRLDGVADVVGQPSDEVFRLAYLNASLQTGMANTLDEAISASKDVDISAIKKQGEIPFDFNRERLGVIVKEDGQCTMIVKGALNSILTICTRVEIAGSEKAMDKQILSSIQQHYEEWSGQGIRIIAVAKKTVALQEKYTVENEKEMVLMGFLLLFDHPKEDVSQTILDLEGKGVSLLIITGDNKLIALHTAEAVGLKVTGVLTGSELMKLSDEALWAIWAGASLFLPFLPLLPKQILLINFLSDFPAITIANDSVDKETVEKPLRWDIHFIRDFMFVFGLVSSVFDYMTFALLFIGFDAKHGLFQSSWFTFPVRFNQGGGIRMFETFYFLLGIVNSLLLITIFFLVRYAKATQVAVAGKIYLALAVPAVIGIVLAQQQQKPVQYTIFLGIFLAFLMLEGIYDFVLKVPFREIWKLLTPYLMLYWSMNYGFIVMTWKHSALQGAILLGLFVIQIIANIRSHTKAKK